MDEVKSNGCVGSGCNVLMIVNGKIDQIREAHAAAVEQIEATHATALETINEKINLHITYMKGLAEDESNRINDRWRVDTEAVAIANERAVKQAEVLATQVAASAEALRILVAQTATTIAQQLAVVTAQLVERIAALEKAQYENVGKAGASPDLQKMVADLENAQNIAKGKAGISNQLMFVIVGVVTSVITAIIFLALKL
jgi:hypothetical protein